MATISRNDESFVERDEVLFPNTDIVETEPHYHNFTAIQNALREGETSLNTYSHGYSYENQFQPIRIQTSSSSISHSQSNESLDRYSTPSYTVPIHIESRKVDGHIFNLTQIVEDIGYNPQTPFIRSSPTESATKNVSALLNIVLKMGGAHGPLVNVWRSRLNDDYFQRWYLEKYHQRSASMTQYNTMRHVNERTTQNTRARDYQSGLSIDHTSAKQYPQKPMDQESYYQTEIRQIYGYDDIDRVSSISSHSSMNEIDSKNSSSYSNQQFSPSITSILKKAGQPSSQTKQHVTIQEPYSTTYPTSSSYGINDRHNTHILSDYGQVLQQHPDVHHDLNPDVITKPNPDHITYQQNISVRYLVPPTPPPPGPLIIREIVPRAPSPPPLIIKRQEPTPPTPPPLILREAPPPRPHQETTVITKVLPPEHQTSRRVIIEHSAPLPPKPQEIIIEKWLPYKSIPPRQVIYERVEEKPLPTEFEPAAANLERQRRYSAEYESNSSRVSVPVTLQRRNSVDHLEQGHITSHPTGTFDELAWRTQQQILALQQRGREQVQAHRQWAANQWQQHANLFLQGPAYLTAPTFTVQQAPVAMNTTAYVQTQEYQQRVYYNPTYVCPLF